MENSILIFDISHLASKPVGETQRYSFAGEEDFEGINLDGPIKGKVEIMRIDEGFNVKVEEFFAGMKSQCEKCLKKFAQTIEIPFMERLFWLETPPKGEDQGLIHFVDKKKLTINITEMLRQEIILHFPLTLVCSPHCKGLCPICGKDRNKVKCKCKPDETAENKHKPFAGLKNLLK